jgi:hypothetical protein
MAIDGPALLQKHNPILVIFPHEPDRRERPGAPDPAGRGWGDYHPCSAEFLLALVEQRDQPRPYDFRGLLGQGARPLRRTGLEELRRRLLAVRPEQTHDWELDIADIPSQDERRAWQAYGALLKEAAYRDDCVVYGRFVRGPSGPALQYWFLYVYNDFWNNHEADWEMATIELKDDGDPVQVGISCHHGGFRRAWDAAPKAGERPIVYVARGSHGGYFAYRREGYPVVDLRRRTNFPLPLRVFAPVVERLPAWRRLTDHPPADPQRDAGAADFERGERIEPALRIMPTDGAAVADGSFWWMRYQGKWGSTHTRIFGTVGIDSPWGPSMQPERWNDPVRWLRSLRQDQA